MAKLFKNNIIKEKLENFEINDFDEKIKILENWNKLYKNWVLEKKTESEIEQSFNEDILWKVLWYSSITENDIYNREPQPKTPEWWQKADFWLGYFYNEDHSKNIINAVIEVKDTKTPLDKPQRREWNLTPIQQWFKYKPFFPKCDFIIVSNFYETRLFIDSYYDYEAWTLDDLLHSKDNYYNFRKFYYLLCKQNLITQKGDSNTKSLLSFIRVQEKEITKEFYKDYSALRLELLRDLRDNNSVDWKISKEKLSLIFEKAQKIIDRIVFIHFCEDINNLLPNWKLKETIDYADNLVWVPIWEILKWFFEAVNSGSSKLWIPDWYNGWLFHEDKELNSLKVWDEICKKFVDLWEYDFADDLSVNILGHIFEQSISDIEEIKEKINKNEDIKSISKRKKDWIFYTPEYIVDYIVKNSVWKKIEEWEDELKEQHKLKEDINDKNYTKRAIQVYTELQEKVQNIKVLDPACWSGAFLVKVFDFLLDKNKEISKKIEDLTGSISMQDEWYFKDILQNNIYWVDLNEESVEITKLSLWLKTASKGKKLANLDKNIKCGNSLIDDKEIAWDKAFVWETEFKEIFDNGWFDVIVGNPPYWAQIQKIDNETTESYLLFYKLWITILNKWGILSFITPDSWLTNNNAIFLRELFIKTWIIYSILDVYKVFSDAPDVWCNIVSFQKDFNKSILQISRNEPYNLDMFQFEINWNRIIQYGWWKWFIYINDELKNIFDKMDTNKSINDFFHVKRWFSPTPNSENIVYTPTDRQIIWWEDFGRYLYKIKPKYLINEYDKSRNQIKDIKNTDFIWIQRIRTNSLDFKSKWLICQFFEKWQFTPIDSIWFIISNSNLNLKYLFVILNSYLFNIYYKLHYTDKNVKPIYLKELPIPELSLSEQKPFIEKADFMLDKNKELQEKLNSTLEFLKQKFEIEKISKKLEKFYELDFWDFKKQLKIKNLGLDKEEDLMSWFNKKKEEFIGLKSEIDNCDREIDDMVFDLYGLSEVEREVVLGSN